MKHASPLIPKATDSAFQNHHICLATIFREKTFWILNLLGLLYFSPSLFLGKTFFFRDLYLHFFFRKQLLADFLHKWQLPLWNEFFHGGRPYWGDLSNAVLQPSNILYAFLSPIVAFNIIIVFHFLLAAAAMYVFVRSLGFKPVSGFIAGVIFEFCGYTLSLGNMLGFLLALPYLPLLFLGWHRFLLTTRRRWLLLAIVFGAIQVCAGAPELCVLSLFSLLVWTLSFPYPRISMLRKLTFWTLLAICLVGVTAIQLVPTIEMIAFSSRGAGIPYQAVVQWSLHPKRVAELVFPGLSGFLDQFPWDVYYWGKHLVDLKYPYVISIYFGGITLVLACLSLFNSGTDDERFPIRIRRTLFALSVSSLFLAFGRFLPGFHALYTYVPLISVFRYPIKFLMVSIFPVALLTAYAVDVAFFESFAAEPPDFTPGRGRSGFRNIKEVPFRIFRNLRLASSGLAVLLLGLAGLFRFSENFAATLIKFWFGDVTTAIARHDLNRTFLHVALIWLGFTILLHACRFQIRVWQPWLLVGMITLDLMAAGIRINSYAPKDFFTAVPAVVPLVQQEREGGRFYRTKNPDQIQFSNLPSADIMWGDRWNLEMLNSSLAAIYGIPLLFHVDYDRLAHQHVATLDTLLDSLPWERRLPILSAGNVTTILTTDWIDAPGTEFISEIQNRSTTPFYLYRNTKAANRVEFVSHWQRVASDNDALRALMAPDYDPRSRVIIQEMPLSPWRSLLSPKAPQQPGRVEISGSPIDPASIEGSNCRPARITTISHSSTKQVLSISNVCASYLVFSEPHYPGWTVKVDGNSAPIFRANYAFSAVFLTTGEHRVERRYRPTSVIAGGTISFLFCSLITLWMFALKNS